MINNSFSISMCNFFLQTIIFNSKYFLIIDLKMNIFKTPLPNYKINFYTQIKVSVNLLNFLKQDLTDGLILVLYHIKFNWLVHELRYFTGRPKLSA